VQIDHAVLEGVEDDIATILGDGIILGAALLDKYEDLKTWFYDSFTTISSNPG